MKRIMLALGLLGLLGACQTTVYPSESHYRNSEAMRAAPVERCQVLEVRQISIGAQEAQSGYGYANVVGQPEEQIGAVLGAALGAAVGSQIGGGSGQKLAMAIGASAGGATGKSQGSRMAQKRMTGPGVEYSILNAAGREQVIVQHLNPGDRIAATGSTCRVAGSGGALRVLPGDQMPSQVARPMQTTFSN